MGASFEGANVLSCDEDKLKSSEQDAMKKIKQKIWKQNHQAFSYGAGEIIKIYLNTNELSS